MSDAVKGDAQKSKHTATDPATAGSGRHRGPAEPEEGRAPDAAPGRHRRTSGDPDQH